MNHAKSILTVLLLVCLLAMFSTGATAARTVFKVPDGIVATKDGMNYWRVPLDGAPAKKLNIPFAPAFVTYIDGEYIATTAIPARIMYSLDGINWMQKTTRFTGVYASGVPGAVFGLGGQLVLMVSDNYHHRLNTCVSSDHGGSWQCNTTIPYADMSRAGYAIGCGGLIAAWGEVDRDTPSGPSVTRVLNLSQGGSTWKPVVVPNDMNASLYCVNHQILVSKVGPSGNDLWMVTPEGLVRKGDIHRPAGGFVSNGHTIFGYYINDVYVSKDDGAHFRRAEGANLPTIYDTVFDGPKYNQGMFVGLGMSGIIQSHDGRHWTPVR